MKNKKHKTIISLKGSKSIGNRALLLAYLAKIQTGKNSSLKNLSDCFDTIVIQKALKNFSNKKIDVKDCGTAFRFLTALKFATNSKVKITGSKKLLSRPIKPLTEALKNLGKTITIRGDISSQFISALLMVAPLAKTSTTIKITGEIFSKPYIEITLNLLKKFGIKIVHDKNLRNFKIAPNQKFKSCNLFIEGDASSASYWGEYAALFGKQVAIKNIPNPSIQGDIKFLDYLKKMGCKISHKKNLIKIIRPKSHKNLRPLGTIDMNSTPDLVPTFAVLSAFANGTTKITNISNLRIKESDRISALEKELKKIGAKVKTGKDFIEIHGPTKSLKKNKIIKTYNDHRIAMAFGILGLKTDNPKTVNKSYPLFWSDLKKLQNG